VAGFLMLATGWQAPKVLAGPIHEAAYKADVPRLRRLLDKHPELVHARDDADATPLLSLASNHRARDKNAILTALRLLLDRGADPTARQRGIGPTPAGYFAMAGNVDAVRLLLDRIDKVAESRKAAAAALRNEALLDAALAEQADVIRLLLGRGADVNARKGDMTPLLEVARGADYFEKVAPLLIRSGADVNARDADGRTPLHWRLKARDLRGVRLLVSHGARINAQDRRGRTPLHTILYTINGVSPSLVEALLAIGADLTLRDDAGRTPLDVAVAQSQIPKDSIDRADVPEATIRVLRHYTQKQMKRAIPVNQVR
jgi:cytohesin